MIDLKLGDCLERMKELDDNSVDSIVTDPPYGLSFMGKHWDKGVPSAEIWAEALRVLKPGGHLLAFAGTRTQHRMAVNIEDAGFEIRDMIAWVYGSGFPKSLNVSKAIDKAAGAERKKVPATGGLTNYAVMNDDGWSKIGQAAPVMDSPTPVTPEAQRWDGWGTALKPALEPITVARKPLIGTVAANVLAHGTGALNVDGCRVAVDPTVDDPRLGGNGSWTTTKELSGDTVSLPRGTVASSALGRWPANLIHDGSDEVVGLFPVTAKNSAARFFYCAKASKKDRNEGCEQIDAKQYSHDGRQTPIENAYQRNASRASNNHPTVKPTDLMRYLCRLVTPPNGIVLDPFMGSGSTGKAAMLEGFHFIGIELDQDYFKIAQNRIAAAIDDTTE